MEKREIIILDCPEIRCPLVLQYVYDELCGGFRRRNYNVKIVNNINKLHNNAIVFMGDKFGCSEPQDLLNSVAPEAIYIGWYWINVNVDKVKYFIHTYENCKVNDARLLKLRRQKYNCPLLLRANDARSLIGSYERKVERDYCYAGYLYREDLIPSLNNDFKGVYHGTLQHENFKKYEERKELYLSSTFALGFQSDENIISGHVSQRIYEGLAYGCVVISNSLAACEETNNIVVHFTTLEDLKEKMNYYKNNPQLIKEKQEAGYELVRKYGTNDYSIEIISSVIKRFMPEWEL